MSVNENITELLKELQLAINNDDKELANKIRNKLLNPNNDELDRDFIETISGKTLYRNLKRYMNDNDSMNSFEIAKMLTSLITHCIIDAEITGNDIKKYPVVDMYIILGYFVNGDTDRFNTDLYKLIKERYGDYIK